MRLDLAFPKQVFTALVIIGCAGAYPLFRYGTEDIIRAAGAGAILTTVNVLLGYAAVEYSFGKSATIFLKYVLGGMGIRMLLVTLVMLLLIKVYQFNAEALIVSMGIFYVVYLALEILFIHKKVSIKNLK